MESKLIIRTFFIDILVIIAELERLLEHLLVSVNRKQRHNDVIFVVTNWCIVSKKHIRILLKLPQPFFIDTIHKRVMKKKDRVV